MSPIAIILDIAIVVAIVGIVVYWVRRFAVFRGYKDIGGAVQQLASALRTQAVREAQDIVVAGHFQTRPAIVRFSRGIDGPALEIDMRAPVTFDLRLIPVTAHKEGRVVMRSGSAELDRKFDACTNTPADTRMFLADKDALANLEQLCCSRHTRLSLSAHSIKLDELAIPESPASHIIDHLSAMARIAQRLETMPGADRIKIEPLPRFGSSWTIRVTLAAGLAALVILLFAQPYSRPGGSNGETNRAPSGAAGVPMADAAHMQKLEGWRVAGPDDLSGLARWFLRQHSLPANGRVTADFSGSPASRDSAYLLINGAGQRRLVMLAGGAVVYDVIFPRADLIATIPHRNLQAIEWNAAPQFAADGDALLVIQNAEDPTQSVVLLRHGTQTYSARPADFNQIEFAP